MKRMLLFVVLMALVSVWGVAYAQTSMDVYATQGNLNEIIEADTLANGAQAHDVYRLVSLDTTYKMTGTLTARHDIKIVGVPDPTTNRPPCVQPAVLQDGSIPTTLFLMSGADTRGTFENIYFLALATNNTANGGGEAFHVSGDNVRLTIDNCVFDGWLSFAIGYNGNWDDFYVTNSHFRNMVHPNQHYIGEVIRNTWPGEAYTDSMVFRGNTMLCINGYAAAPVTKWYQTYFEFSENKVLYTFKNPFFIFNVTDAKINNNLFYANYSGGVDQTENPWWDNLWDPDTTYGVIALQPLSWDNAGWFNPSDTTAAEGLRMVEVNNNDYYWPTTVTNFWANWNNTQANTIITPTFMNDPTTAMFADNTNYPFLNQSGNTNSDPGFMANLDNDILNGTSGNDIGMLAWFEQIRTGTAATDVWGYAITQVGTAEDWVPVWPLPENTFIPQSVEETFEAGIPDNFKLEQNYPNPFNPSTTISFSLKTAEKVTLNVYNVVGQVVETLVNDFKPVGTYTVKFDASALASGVYYYELTAGQFNDVRKMLLIK